jgi:hypothetical protein
MPRFVVLFHETPAGSARGKHFDLMLEHDGVLRTWAMEKMPATGEIVAAEKLPDHRLHYLDYEGEVSGNRGDVRRVDAGVYYVVEENATTIVASLRGEKLRGTITLDHDDGEPHRWRVSFSPG